MDQRPIVAAAALTRYGSGRDVVAAGVWAGWQPGGTRSPEALGSTGVVPSEVDLWGQYTRENPWGDVSVGVIRYEFHERNDLADTEAYLQVWPEWRSLPADVKGTVYVGLARGSGTYAELDASRVFPLIPLPTAPIAARVGMTAGFSLDAGAAESFRAFSSQGPTHVGLSAILTFATGPLAIRAGGRYQRSFEAARRFGDGDIAARPWFEAGVSYSLGALAGGDDR